MAITQIDHTASGALVKDSHILTGALNEGNVTGTGLYTFDASRQVPISHENRPAAIAALACITY